MSLAEYYTNAALQICLRNAEICMHTVDEIDGKYIGCANVLVVPITVGEKIDGKIKIEVMCPSCDKLLEKTASEVQKLLDKAEESINE